MALKPLGLDPDEPLVRTAVLGFQVQEWWDSPVGSFIRERVVTTLDRLTQQLKTISPTDPFAITRLQAEIKHWEGFAGWIGEAIQAYHSATEIIDGERDAEDA